MYLCANLRGGPACAVLFDLAGHYVPDQEQRPRIRSDRQHRFDPQEGTVLPTLIDSVRDLERIESPDHKRQFLLNLTCFAAASRDCFLWRLCYVYFLRSRACFPALLRTNWCFATRARIWLSPMKYCERCARRSLIFSMRAGQSMSSR